MSLAAFCCETMVSLMSRTKQQRTNSVSHHLHNANQKDLGSLARYRKKSCAILQRPRFDMGFCTL